MKYLLILFCGVWVYGCSHGVATKTEAAPSVTMTMPFESGEQIVFDTISLGRIGSGEIVNGSFAISNNSMKPIVIVNIVNGCGCTTVDYDTSPILGGDSRTINFAFDSEGKVGWQLKSIDVVMSDHTMGRVFVEAEVVDIS